MDLCSLIESQGGHAIAFPTIEIKPASGFTPDQLIEDLNWSNFVIFISRNAVFFSYKLVTDLTDKLAYKKVFATGLGTSDALYANGLENVICPDGESGTEGLLANPELSELAVQGKHVLIVRGHGGREKLKETIEARKADVKYSNVYVRRLPEISPETVDSIWRQEIPDIIVVTSVEGLQNLVKLTAQNSTKQLFGRKLVVMSQRIAEYAADLGFTNSTMVVREQSNRGLMQAIRNSVE
jgi:uroporphyrinogen-III synthase